MKRFLLSILCLACSIAWANTWVVPDSLSTIQAAIDTSASGDTVLVTGSHQNLGPIEIINKQISLLSKNYISNPASYSISSGTALFDTLNSSTLLSLTNADNSVIMGFLFDKSDVGNGGGIVVKNSENIIFQALHFVANPLLLENSSLENSSSKFYNLDSSSTSLITLVNSTMDLHNTSLNNNNCASLLNLSTNSEIRVHNLVNYNNSCQSNLYNINSSYAYFNFITSYGNYTPENDWFFSNSYVLINSSILENNPPLDIAQCEISYSALPGPYPGSGNLFDNPQIDSTSSLPILLPTSPCISAANPDTSGIAREDYLGNIRPNPEWAPPDMGAFESSRYMLQNNSSTLWISKEGHDIWGNGSLDYPFASLQTAIDYAENTDTLIFKPGTYYGQATIYDKSLTISSEYIMNSDTTYRDSVVLIPNTNIYSPIITATSLDSLNIYGLTFKNGSGRFFYNNYTLGGALYFESLSKIDLKHCLFQDNQADYAGGAIFALDSYLEMNNISFKNNTAYLGGAVSLSSSIANVSYLYFTHNIASSGAALYADNTSKLIAFYTHFSDNIANNDSLDLSLEKPSSISQYGGAIYSTNSELWLYNCLLVKNAAKNKGSAIALRGGKLNLLQSTLSENTSDDQTKGMIYIKDPSDEFIIANSILWNENEDEIEMINTELRIENSCIQNGESALISDTLSSLFSSNIFTSDPEFDTNYSLQTSSPYVNSGLSVLNNSSYYLLNYNDSQYEGTHPGLGYTGAQANIEFVLEEYQSSIDNLPTTFNLLHAYPNPFNPSTTLEFTLSKDANTRLELYDIKGRHLKTLLNDYLYSGNYRFTLNAHEFSSGIYICRLSQNGLALSNQKLLLVK